MPSLRSLPALVAVLLALLAALPPAIEARCAPSRLRVQLITPLASPLPRGADLVLALRPHYGQRGEDATFPGVTIGTEGMAGGNLALPTELAPGLARVSLTGMPPGRHTLRGLGDAELHFQISDRALPTAPSAPIVSSITVSDRGRSGISISADIQGRSHAAFVLEAGGAPIGYGLPRPQGPADLLPFGRCASRPAGLRPIAAGESITVRGVDTYGRLSPPSTPVVAR